jgi:AcrR family transcriptional regulator
MQREWLTTRQCDILDLARELVSTEGVAAVSIGRLARELAVEPCLLYEHFADTDELLTELTIDVLIDQAVALQRARQDLLGQARAYREFALEHPELYRLITERELPRESAAPGLNVGAVRALIDALGPDLARAAWAFAHGMVELELDKRFSPDADLDSAWRAGVAAFAAAAARTPQPSEQW